MRHIDLFSGIGGFSLAVDRVWHEENNEHIFVEWDDFCTAVLKKHWPEATYYGDIADLVADTTSKQSGGVQQSKLQPDTSTSLTILTGGFPCQPFSHAGRRKGTADDRYKWPEMFAVIRNVRPDWVIAENVRGLVTWNEGMVLETVCADLESEGYEVQPFIIPAVAVGAPHRRDRVWIIANNISQRPCYSENKQELEGKRSDKLRVKQSRDFRETITNTRQQMWSERSSEGVEADTTVRATCSETNQREHQHTWSTDWREVALATCHDRVDDGLPRWMDGVAISAARHRKERLKACGNAIVPAVAEEIMRAIRLVDETRA